jgi:hypothetical protein
MSSVSEHDHLNPNDPAYYAPPRTRERADSRSSLSRETRSEPVRSPISSPASLDMQLKNAVSDALWHSLDPEVIHEPPGIERELDRRTALMSVAGRVATAVGVSGIVALFFVIMLPALRLPDGGSTTSAILQSMKSALLQPGQRGEDSKPAIAEFQTILASVPTSQLATHAQSEQLLQQFLRWRQRPNAAEAPR